MLLPKLTKRAQTGRSIRGAEQSKKKRKSFESQLSRLNSFPLSILNSFRKLVFQK
ncbi:hypothetical protein ACFP3I_16170 [Chryseobacterium arachidis]|uniref:hypothetical protein n=1 Tax=Chryseobacterium arachidis TaxID=1416778 RepID=UPI003615CA3C